MRKISYKSYSNYKERRKEKIKQTIEFIANCVLMFVAGGFMAYVILTHL